MLNVGFSLEKGNKKSRMG